MHPGKKKTSSALTNQNEQIPSSDVDINLRLQQQEAIAWFGEYALSCTKPDDLFAQCVQLTARVLDLELAKILELLPDGQELLLRAGVGWHTGLMGQVTVGAGIDSQAGYTLLTETPIVVSDLRKETRFHGPKLLFDHQVISGMSVTILGKNHPYGVLGVHTTRPRVFTDQDTRFLKSIANILAFAIERFQAEADLRDSRNELAVILNGIREGVTAQDRSGRLVYANRAAARLLGYASADELLQTPLAEVMQKFQMYDEHGQPLSVEKLPNRLALATGEPASAKVRFRIVATGEDHWSIVDSSPVLDAQGKTILAVNFFHDITDSVRQEQLQRLMAEAGTWLSSSLDYETTLTNVATLAVSYLADWCSVHIVTEAEEIRPLVVAHKDPQKVTMARQYSQQYPSDWKTSPTLASVLRSGKAEYFPQITDEMLQASARDAEHLALMRSLGMRAAMLLPLVARDKVLGAISLIWAESGRTYSAEEVAVMQELARRAATAIDNAILYRAAQTLNTELEQRVASQTEQLQRANRQLMEEIAERTKAEAALRQSESLLESLFESAPDATVLVDKRGQIVRINRQAEAVFGYSRDELVGKPITILLPERYRVHHTQHQSDFFKQAITRPMGAGRVLYARRNDGQEFPVDIMLSPVFNSEGDLVISSIRDITEQRRMEAELAETHQRLFESVEAERLSLARELHDGPIQDLYGLRLNQEGLNALSQSPKAIETLEKSKETVQEVIRTLRNICSELRPVALDSMGLEKVIRAHVAMIQETHPDIRFELQLMNDQQELPERVRLAIYRVFQNAMSNVIRHSQATNVLVKLAADEHNLFLQVQDNGLGFTVPDKWVELARSGHFGLVGMVERVQAVGGTVTVRSAPGIGTNLLVNVPIRFS